MNMRILQASIAGILVLAAAPAEIVAQVDLSLRLEHSVTLQYEPVVAFISVKNTGVEKFVLGGDTNLPDVVFTIRSMDTRDVLEAISGRMLVAQKITVPPDSKQEVMVDVSRHFNLSTMGRYMINVSLSVNGMRYESAKSMLDVVKGLSLTSVSRALPGTPDRIRTYTLRYWAREGRESLFLLAEEEKPPVNYAVIHLGHIVRVTPPRIEVDSAGNVNVIHQCTPDVFTRSILRSRSSGVDLVDQQFLLRDGSPYVPKERGAPLSPATGKGALK